MATMSYAQLVSSAAPLSSSTPSTCCRERAVTLRQQLLVGRYSLRDVTRAAKIPGITTRLRLTGLTSIRAQAGQDEIREPKADSGSEEKIPFGYTRKDVILIGVGLIGVGVGIKFGLEAFGVDSLRAGNAVQLIMVLGLTLGWISSYVFRVSTKEMTYAKQLKDYENKVMEKRLEELPEAELETMLAQIEEEKRQLQDRRKNIL